MLERVPGKRQRVSLAQIHRLPGNSQRSWNRGLINLSVKPAAGEAGHRWSQPGMHDRLSVRCIRMLQRKCSAPKLILSRLTIGIGKPAAGTA